MDCDSVLDEDEDYCDKCGSEFRVCAKCGCGMCTGYVYNSNTYCSGECLPIPEKQFDAEYEDDGDNYYTEWLDNNKNNS